MLGYRDPPAPESFWRLGAVGRFRSSGYRTASVGGCRRWIWVGAGLLCGRVRLFRPHPSLARHLPHPGEGYCGDSVRHRDSADSSVRLRGRTEKIRTAGRSLPPGGEGGAPAPDEGEIGERNHVTQPSRRSSLPFEGEGGAKRRMRAKQASVEHNAPHPPKTHHVTAGNARRRRRNRATRRG